MIGTTLENALETVTTEEQEAALEKEVFAKFQNEFLDFVEDVRKTGIVQKMMNAKDGDELRLAWDEFYAQNKKLLNRIMQWWEERETYFGAYECLPLFKGDAEEMDCILEVALIVYGTGEDDDVLFVEDDFPENFVDVLVALLKESENEFIRLAANYIEFQGIYYVTYERILNWGSNQ